MGDMQRHQLTSIVGDASHAVFSALKSYEARIEKWQPRINLVANSTLSEIWSRHILDSAQLWPLAKEVQKGGINWVDFGSGGGFPGLVISIFMKEEGRGHITLVESNSKKAAFLRQVAAELRLPVTILNKRIETCHSLIEAADIVTARALAPLPQLLTWIAPYFTPHSTALLQKGRDNAQEVAQARESWDFNVRQHSSLIDPQSVILQLTDLHKR